LCRTTEEISAEKQIPTASKVQKQNSTVMIQKGEYVGKTSAVTKQISTVGGILLEKLSTVVGKDRRKLVVSEAIKGARL